MILFASMRTDIPSFYAPWLIRRIREGYVLVRSPYDRKTVYRYSLSPESVDALGFCTKDPGPMLPFLDEPREYRTLWHITLTGYGKDMERGVRDKTEIVEDVKKLSALNGGNVFWRYDPVLLSPRYGMEEHRRMFSSLTSSLSGSVEECIISFLDVYPSIREECDRLSLRPPTREEGIALMSFFVEEGRKRGIRIRSCGEGEWPALLGADTSGCLRRDDWERAASSRLVFPREKRKRDGCACFLPHDIGTYGSCGHGCVYCYASGAKSKEKHDPRSPMLLGWPEEGDRIVDGDTASWKDRNGYLF